MENFVTFGIKKFSDIMDMKDIGQIPRLFLTDD